MKPELVSEKKIGTIADGLVRKWRGEHGRSVRRQIAVEAIHAALKELGIAWVVSSRWGCPLSDEGLCALLQDECGGWDERPDDCPLKKGAVLVRAQPK